MVSELDRLREFSARIGSDPELVQAAGGNTSLKSGDELVIKASGKRLADALREDIFIGVSLREARTLEEIPSPSAGLRPSIETSLHAALQHRVVAHVHSVDVLAYAVRVDARERLGEKLSGVAWAYVPYARPGRPLALAVREAAQAEADVFVLANHGLLVGGNDFEACERLIGTVRERLSAEPRAGAPRSAALDAAAARTGLVPALDPAAHWSALDPEAMRAATVGSLYPDHVVFLGRGATPLGENAMPSSDNPSKLYLIAGVGALLPADASTAAHEMAGCLGMVAARVPPGAAVRTLTHREEDELLNWDAEKHRQTLAGAF